MLFCAKYGGILTEDNLAGTSLTVDAFSDHLGNTEPVTVVPGDVVINITLDEETGKTYGTFWTVFDGDPWVEIESVQRWFTSASDSNGAQLVASTADDLPYQRGGLAIYYPDGSFAAANLGTILTITDNL